MGIVKLVLLLLALVFFGLASFSVPSGRFNFVGAGLFCCTLAYILGGSVVGDVD